MIVGSEISIDRGRLIFLSQVTRTFSLGVLPKSQVLGGKRQQVDGFTLEIKFFAKLSLLGLKIAIVCSLFSCVFDFPLTPVYDHTFQNFRPLEARWASFGCMVRTAHAKPGCSVEISLKSIFLWSRSSRPKKQPAEVAATPATKTNN